MSIEVWRPIYDCFLDAVQKSYHRTALKYRVDGKYTDITYSDLNRMVDEVAAGLSSLGIGKGDRVALFSYNRPEWAMVDLAALKLGAVVVPIYHTLTAPTVAYILKDSDAKVMFVESPELFEIASEALPGARRLKDVISFFATEPGRLCHTCVQDFASLRRTGSGLISRAEIPPPAKVDVLDLATVIYTSGTTGEPKGVMLSHRNIVSNAWTAARLFGINQEDTMVSFLPLCHAFERTAGYYTMIFSGGTIAYAGSIQTVAEDVKEIRPTLLITVPRMLEKVYEAVQGRIDAGSVLKRGMALSAVKVFSKYAHFREHGHRIPPLLKLKRRILKSLVVDKIHAISGGRLRAIMSGGAPLGRRLARIARNFEFPIAEGYGLSEAAPVVAVSVPAEYRVGTVGKPLPGVEVRVSAEGEVLVRGPNVMMGYLNKPEATAEVIDNEGWLHTGDMGRLDEKGYLTITGRIKELIVTSYGKNIAPVPIEDELCRSQYVEQAMVYGDRKAYLVALVVPRKAAVESLARTLGVSAPDYPSLLKSAKLHQQVEADVLKRVKDLAPFEQVKAIALIPEPFTVDNDLLTPTLKLRRPKIVERWQQEIQKLYDAKR